MPNNEITPGSVTVSVQGPELIVGNTYLAIKQHVEPDNVGEVEELKIIKETQTSYKFQNVTDPNYPYEVWYVKTAIINTGDLNNTHAYKIIEDVTNETQG